VSGFRWKNEENGYTRNSCAENLDNKDFGFLIVQAACLSVCVALFGSTDTASWCHHDL